MIETVVDYPQVEHNGRQRPTAFESISVDLPPCGYFRRLWISWDDIPDEIRQELCELAESYATKETLSNAGGLVPVGDNSLD